MILKVLGNTLDEEQTKAALTNNINTIIIAGAGSGKSLTMVGKIKYLVLYNHIPLKDILCLTFTNDAAQSLEKKIIQELNQKTKVYTFHKLALEIIKSHNYPFQICEADLLEYLIEEITSSIDPTYFKKKFLTKNFLKSSEFTKFKSLISKFIHLYQARFSSSLYFYEILERAPKQEYPYLKFIQKIYDMYILEKKASNLLDFDDMIKLATTLVKTKGINKTYKYIIIDEYQDTSQIRENLVKEIIKKTHAYLTVVGDDFQSIYRFSGCDLNNFLNFTQNFKPAQKLYLTSTYRNSQELINIAGDFIMQNPSQIKKNLHSSKLINKPIIILYYKNIQKDFFKALKYINKPKIMILGRNNHDIYDVLPSSLIQDNEITYASSQIYYKTIHKSKGLEEDNILIINLTAKASSLPSQIKDSTLLKYVLTTKDTYPYEEERRLFYVALTRTKNYCYLYVDKKNPSLFIKELIKNYKKDLTIINL